MTAIIFDLDGTLIDSAPDICAAVNALMAERDLPAFSLQEVTGFIGNGIGTLTARAMAARGQQDADIEATTARLLTHYNADPMSRTELYPGVRDVLQGLKADGHRLGICTNKPHAPTLKILEAFDLASFFETVIGGDTCPTRKPDPAPLRRAMAELGMGRCLYVGDSEVDAATAVAADVPFALFTQGYRKTPVAEVPHNATFDHWPDVPGIVARLT